MSVFVIEPGSLAGGGEERSLIEMLLLDRVGNNVWVSLLVWYVYISYASVLLVCVWYKQCAKDSHII